MRQPFAVEVEAGPDASAVEVAIEAGGACRERLRTQGERGEEHQQGAVRAHLGIGGHGSSLSLNGAKGEPRVTVLIPSFTDISAGEHISTSVHRRRTSASIASTSAT